MNGWLDGLTTNLFSSDKRINRNAYVTSCTRSTSYITNANTNINNEYSCKQEEEMMKKIFFNNNIKEINLKKTTKKLNTKEKSVIELECFSND